MGYRLQHWTPLWWLLSGNPLYYSAAIPMAILLKDNRAFCKYLCPAAVLMKLGSRFSPLKIGGVRKRCDSCMACVKMCPIGHPNSRLHTGGRAGAFYGMHSPPDLRQCMPDVSLVGHVGVEVGGKERLEQRLQ